MVGSGRTTYKGVKIVKGKYGGGQQQLQLTFVANDESPWCHTKLTRLGTW